MTPATTPKRLSRQYAKLCDLPDFDDDRLRAMLREIVAPGYEPTHELRRKFWEYAMLGLYLEEVGALTEEASALAVAAGHEEPLFWLANRIERVVATDIYGEGGFSAREADASMLTNPEAFAPYPYRESHLSVKAMNALELEFEDESFDIVFSLSSIEHFDGLRRIEQAAREMSRVLKPGGHLVIVTECLVSSHPLDWPPVQLAIRAATLGRRCAGATLRNRVIDAFRPNEIMRYIVRPTGLELDQPLDTSLAPETYTNITRWTGGGELAPATGVDWPHILLQAQGAPWTSVFLPFSKPD